MSMEDKRKSARLPVDFEVAFTHETQKYQGRFLNISAEGGFLKASRLFDPGDLLDLTFRLPGRGEPLNVQGRVAWGGSMEGSGLTTFGTGVQFENLSQSAREEIGLFIRHLLKA